VAAPIEAPDAASPPQGGATAALSGAPLLAADGTALPQLEDRPSAESPAFRERMRLLVAAIARDDPALAAPAFFPLVAYEQVKAIANPGRDWRARLVAAFERNVHEYHRALGRNGAELELVSVEVDEPRVRWMKPGSEGNRVGYHRVLRSRLRVADGAGKQRSFEITSLISWRGEWYVVHLNGFE